MINLTQDGRLMAVTTPLGKDVLLLEKLSATEGISQLFRVELELLTQQTDPIAFDKLLGQPVSVVIHSNTVSGTKRYFHGIVSRLSEGAELRGRTPAGGEHQFVRYSAEVVPKIWLLTRKMTTRSFQQMSVPDILKKVLTGYDVDYRLKADYQPRDYCLQYRETDFHFISRLMEEEGIYYYFTHSAGGHKLILSDHPGGHDKVPGPEKIVYQPRGPAQDEDWIYNWQKSQELRSGKHTLRDYCFEMPSKTNDQTSTVPASAEVGTVKHKLAVGGNDKLEVYDYPGEFAQRFDGVDPGGGKRAGELAKINPDGKRTNEIRMQAETAQALSVRGAGFARHLTPGHKFSLDNHFSGNGEYVVTQVEHSASLVGHYLGEQYDDQNPYQNSFTAVPVSVPYRPLQVTPVPTIPGPMPAVVVGPPGEEIFTDEYGRVKVQFPWDREGKKDQTSSCWVRVATPWGGKQWGTIHIPRVGMEVLVAFENGHMDRPVIVGCLYNAEMMPPYTLPANKTQSGVKSRSSLKGSAENFNELRFEDKKDEEQIYLHAEKNLDVVVENNETRKVGFDKKDKGDQVIEIYNAQELKVGLGSKMGGRTTTVQMDDTSTVKQGNRSATIEMGNDALTIKMGNQTTKLNLGKSDTEAMQSITLKVGQSSIKVDQMGVTIKGMVVTVEGQIQTNIKGLMTDVKGTAMLTAGGAITMIG
jgi:type VI secretion system secreted protein VgrG